MHCRKCISSSEIIYKTSSSARQHVVASQLDWEISSKCVRVICDKLPSGRPMGDFVQWHISFPSIIYWTLFNEGWGQFDTVETIRWASKLDPSRLWDAASGWVDPADPTSSPSTSNHGNATVYVRSHPFQRCSAVKIGMKHRFVHHILMHTVNQCKRTAGFCVSSHCLTCQ